MGFWTEYNPATGIVFEGLADQGDTGGGGSASTWSGATPEQLFAAARAGRISWAQVKMELQSQRTGVSDLNPEGTRKYGDSIIDSMIDDARAKADSSSTKTASAGGVATAKPGDFMAAQDSATLEASAPRRNPGSYSEGTEQWRQLVMDTMPPALRARPDAEMLADKMLYVIEGESGGDPNIPGDGGNGYGLVQDRVSRTPPGTPPEQQLINAWKLVSKNPDQWTDWGEGVLYDGKPFGALGAKPYGGSSSGYSTSSGSANGWNETDIKSAIDNFKKLMQPRVGSLQFKSATGMPGDFPGLRVNIADLGQNFRDQGLNADMLQGFGELRGNQAVPTSDYWEKQGILAKLMGGDPTGATTGGPAAAATPPAAANPSAMAKLLGAGNYGMEAKDYKGFGFAEGGSVGPAGRSFEQATGQQYLSDDERAWYLAEVKRRGGVLDPGAQQFLGDYEARAPQQAPAIGTGGYQQRALTPEEQAKINGQNTAVAAAASNGTAAPAAPAAASSVRNPQATTSSQQQATRVNPSDWMYSGASADSGLRTAISAFNDWQTPRFQQLQFRARTGMPADFPGIRVGLADMGQNYREQGLSAGDRINGFNEFAGSQSIPESDYYRKIGFAGGGTAEAYSTANQWRPRSMSPRSVETNRPVSADGLRDEAVTRFTGPNETDVGLMGKSARFGGFQNLSNILRNLNTIGRDFQGQDLSAGYRVPGFNPLQSEVYQRLFRSDVPSNIQYAAGGTAGPMLGENPGMVAQNPDGTPHLMLNEPADLIGRESGRHYAEAGEVGTMEGVSADGQGGLNFTPTGIPQVGPQTQLAVGSAIMQLLSGRRSNQRRGRYKPAPVGSTPPPPSRRVNELLGVA